MGRGGFRRILAAALIAAAALAPTLVVAPAPAAAFDFKLADQSVLRVVVFYFKADGTREQSISTGTGFVVDDEHVLTNDHVLDLAEAKKKNLTAKPFLLLETVEKRLEAQVVWTSPEFDLAVLKVPGLKRPPVTLTALAPPAYPPKGADVFVIGFPGAADNLAGRSALATSTVSKGNVGRIVEASAKASDKERFAVQHNATTNKGNSGSPVFDACNVVVAIDTFGEMTELTISKNEKGETVAGGETPQGVNFAPHIVYFLNAAKSAPELKGLKLRLADKPCEPDAGGMPLAMQIAVYGGVGLAVLLGLFGSVLALRKGTTREVVRVVESYSAWVRRKGAKVGDPRSASGTSGAPTGAEARRSARDAGAAPAAKAAAGAWRLRPKGGKGAEIAVTAADLARAAASKEGGLVLGRSATMADRVIDDPSVSRRHARLTADAEGLIIEDLNSAHGTTVNGQRLAAFAPTRCGAGDALGLGGAAFDIVAG